MPQLRYERGSWVHKMAQGGQKLLGLPGPMLIVCGALKLL